MSQAKPSLRHECHAAGCSVAVPPKMFMCRKHWYMLTKELRDSVWATYRPGQEVDKKPSITYLLTTAWCICFVADKEGVPHEHVRSKEAQRSGK
jgi:hypothetical protein